MLPHVFESSEWMTISKGMLQGLRNVLPTMRNVIFISNDLEKSNALAEFTNFVSQAAEKIEEINTLNGEINLLSQSSNPPTAASNLDWLSRIEKRTVAYQKLYGGFHEQAGRIRKIAWQALASSRESIDEHTPAPSTSGE
jgi:hypothetical protein